MKQFLTRNRLLSMAFFGIFLYWFPHPSLGVMILAAIVWGFVEDRWGDKEEPANPQPEPVKPIITAAMRERCRQEAERKNRAYQEWLTEGRFQGKGKPIK